MSITLAPATQPPEHAPWCPGGCARWLAVDTPGCQPYPCRCSDYKASKPAWGRERCWWTKRNTDRIISECPCWGRARYADMPGSCCAHHSANPRYAPPPVVRSLDDLDVAPYIEWDRPAAPVNVALLDWNGFDPEVEHSPYERMWTHEELHCDCPEPATWKKTSSAVHCTGCHEHFVNPGTFAQHRKIWWEPCRPPHTIVDVDTGRPLLRPGADGIWAASYPTAD